MTGSVCPHCGGNAPNLQPPGRVVLVEDVDVRRMRELLRARVDQDRCMRCGFPVDLVPSVFVLFGDSSTVVGAPGTLLRDPPGAAAAVDWRRVLPTAERPVTVEACTDLDDLRRTVRRRLARHDDLLARLLDAAARDGTDAFLAEHWRDLPPAVLTSWALQADDARRPAALPDGTAQRLVAAGHVLAPLVDRSSPVERRLAAVEAVRLGVWSALCAEWTARLAGSLPVPGPAATLQGDLDRHVVGAALLLGVDGPASLFGQDSWNPGLSGYVRHALHAAVARAAGETDPAAVRWAEFLLAHETAAAMTTGAHRERLDAGRLSADFLRATVGREAAWIATTGHLGLILAGLPQAGVPPRPLAEAVRMLDEILTRAGHPHLVAAVVEQSARSALGPAPRTAEIVEALTATARPGGTGVTLATATLLLDALPGPRRAAETDGIGRSLFDLHSGADRGDVVVWWARALLRAGRPGRARTVVEELGGHVATPVARIRLLGLRASLLDAGGDAVGARGLWEEAVAAVARLPQGADGDTRDGTERLHLDAWARINLALALARTGSPDRGHALLVEVADGDHGTDPALSSLLGVGLVRFGEVERGLSQLATAEDLAGSARAGRRHGLQRVHALVIANRPHEAVDALSALPEDDGDDEDVVALLAEAAALVALERRVDLPTPWDRRSADLVDVLGRRAERAARDGDVVGRVDLLRRRADIRARRDADSAAAWEEVVALRRHHGLPDDPEELVRAAGWRLRSADADGMRELLVAVPDALTHRYGAVADIGLLVEEPAALVRPLAELAGAIVGVEPTSAADVRLVAELQRDAVGRSRAAHHRRVSTGPDWTGHVVGDVPLHDQPLSVVEWVRTGEKSFRCLLTRVADDRSECGYLALAPVDPVVLARRLTARLDAWNWDADVDPLLVPDWEQLAGSVVDAIGAVVPDGEHVVFLRDRVYDLPWHTTVQDRWEVSYAAGWGHLRSLLREPPARPGRVGVCVVPHGRDVGNTAVLRRGAARVERAAQRLGTVEVPPSESCDGERLRGVLATSDLTVMLCHGYHSERDGDVGWLLARGGQLPSTGPAVDTAAHRFGWRDCLHLDRASPVVVSAACASGWAVGAGLGDRLGLFTALRSAGTRSMIAPAWPVTATDVVDVVTDLTRRYLAGERLGAALRAACRTASRDSPVGLSRALALDGDWR
jgi:hypothetical protein